MLSDISVALYAIVGAYLLAIVAGAIGILALRALCLLAGWVCSVTDAFVDWVQNGMHPRE